MTGTLAGDPVEAEAIARTFGTSRKPEDPVIVDSIKTNIGHTEPVSGLAAIIKTVFALKNAQIPPNMNYEKPNPEIPVDEWHLRVPLKLTAWPKDKLLRASINNFGYGGTNGHAILEPVPKSGTHSNGSSAIENGSHQADKWLIFVLSAKDSVACRNIMRRFADHIVKSPAPAADLAYTLSERRSMHPWVSAISARTWKNWPIVCERQGASHQVHRDSHGWDLCLTARELSAMQWAENSSLRTQSSAEPYKRLTEGLWCIVVVERYVLN